MALAASQKLTRVLPGRPFGDGRDGALTISSDTTQSLTIRSCSGTAASNTLTIASGAFSNTDVVIILQVRGTGAGNWEVNQVSSGGGTTSLTLSHALVNTYTDSGASQAMVFKLPMYTSITLSSNTWTASAWTGDVHGSLAFAANVGISGAGNISVKGKGYNGGAGTASANTTGGQGESSTGAGATGTGANGSGGGGSTGQSNERAGGGGGGGYATSGSTGTAGEGGGDTPGTGGGTSGAAELTTFLYGAGGGGSGVGDGIVSARDGGVGGGGIFAFVKNWGVTGTTNLNGNDGVATTSDHGGTGAGSGGSLLGECETATLGSGLITASGGTGGTGTGGQSIGGDGGAGRIAIHHSGTVTGTTTPTFNDTTDSSLVETLGGMVLFSLA